MALTAAMFSACLGFATQDAGKHKAKPRARSALENQAANDEISGMYTFLREGEFVQITVEDGSLSGFVSRYGDRDSDRDAFLDQFFSKASLTGKKISFVTKPVHGTWFEFAGEVSRGEAKSPDKEGYRIIRGTLKEYDEDDSKHVSAKSREVTFKSFPQDVEGDQQPK
ncbi:MAG TPA: hypothetical protein VH196_06465 [Terriglobales bacterium]|nr:hypothetical protein [Terriglobales bacterium]